MTNHDQHNPACDSRVSTALTTLAIGGAVVVGGLMLAPHILPSLGIGSAQLAADSMDSLHLVGGIAGDVNVHILSNVPFVGSALAEGGFFNAIASGLIGFGGLIFGEVLTHEDNSQLTQNLGTLIKWGALATSALIAMPTVLTAISTGLIFLSTLSPDITATSTMIDFVYNTIGTMGEATHSLLGLSGLAAVAPHLATCGVAALPAALSLKQWHEDRKEECELAHQPAPQTFAEKVMTNRKPDTRMGYVALDTKGKPLPDSDPNHNLTTREVALVEQYESAKDEAQRASALSTIRRLGYNPDVHGERIHLYQHGASHAPSCAR